MIVDALSFLRNQINVFSGGGPQVEFGNVSRYNTGEAFTDALQNKVLLSLVNIEEDRVVRNVQHFRKEGAGIVFKNPPFTSIYLCCSPLPTLIILRPCCRCKR